MRATQTLANLEDTILMMAHSDNTIRRKSRHQGNLLPSLRDQKRRKSKETIRPNVKCFLVAFVIEIFPGMTYTYQKESFFCRHSQAQTWPPKNIFLTKT